MCKIQLKFGAYLSIERKEEEKIWSLTTMVNGPGVEKDISVIELHTIKLLNQVLSYFNK